MSSVIGIGIAGFGTVGRATAQIVSSHAPEIASRCGARLEVRGVCRRTVIAPADLPAGARAYQEWRQLVANPEIAIVVETMGGLGIAREVIEASLALGKPVVTANKNLLAHHGESLFAQAAAQGLPLGIEAAVAGGIPVIRALAEGTAGDRIRSVYGILNGTANYILSRMAAEGLGFAEALSDAQRLGYAEFDPSADVDGLDARDKLAILARLAFGGRVLPDSIPATGIRAISAIDLLYARRLQSTIRLVGAAERGSDGRCALSVRPWLVREHSLLAQVQGVNNAVFVEGERVGTQMFYGRGAGGDATGIAVLSDLMEIAGDFATGRLSAKPAPGFRTAVAVPVSTAPTPVPWYLRLVIRDQPGVLARLAVILAQHNINIDFVLQEPNMDKARLPFVITVEPVSEPLLLAAVAALNASGALLEPVLPLRIYALESS